MRIIKLFFIVLLVTSLFPVFILLSCSRPVSEMEGRVTETTPTEPISDGFELILEKTDKGMINALAFSPMGKQLAVASSEGLWIYDTDGGREPSVLIGHEGEVLASAWSDDKTLASGGKDKTVRLWDAKTGKLLKTLEEHTGEVNVLTFSPDGKTLVSGSRSKVDYFSKLPDKPMKSLFEEPIKLPSDPDELTEYLDELDKKNEEYINEESRKRLDRLLGLSNSENFDNTIRLWNAETGEFLQTIKGSGNALSFVDNRTLVSASSGRLVVPRGFQRHSIGADGHSVRNILVAENGEDNGVSTLGPGSSYQGQFYRYGASICTAISSIVFSPDGTKLAKARARVIASGGSETYESIKIKVIMTSDSIMGYPTTNVKYIDVKSLIAAMAFSPSGNYLAIGGPEASIQLWDVKGKKPLHTFDQNTVGATALALSKDGMLASGNRDGIIFLWRAK
ncbi:hypothetical protein F4Z99_13010 [Candidatus Poribacteria bacterium]|nr:hypothetical protein [Candidatus Poribacteria bacterium]MYA98251.1 hypothetical protein [Candidatus Poribacteria bacterium]